MELLSLAYCQADKQQLQLNMTFKLLMFVMYFAEASHHDSDDPLAWLGNSVPGIPGVDYPIHADTSLSTFSCEDRLGGHYYADTSLSCQAYHLCLMRTDLLDVLRRVSFLCPNGTIFNQATTVCDWW